MLGDDVGEVGVEGLPTLGWLCEDASEADDKVVSMLTSVGSSGDELLRHMKKTLRTESIPFVPMSSDDGTQEKRTVILTYIKTSQAQAS